MSNFFDATTIYKTRQLYQASDIPTRDDLLLAMIQSTTREIEEFANRQYYPVIATYRESAPRQGYGTRFSGLPPEIVLHHDLLAITSVTNGDGTVLVKGTDYETDPLDDTPYSSLVTLEASGTAWLPTTAGNYRGAISIAGVWGYHSNYGSAWIDTLAVASAISTTSTTSVTATAGKVYAGDLIQIDSEWMYVVSVSTGASDTLTVRRGVNGSTAATHGANAIISRYTFEAIEDVCRTGVVAYYRTRNHPTGETVTIDGQTFSTPKDVHQWINKRLMGLGLIRTGMG